MFFLYFLLLFSPNYDEQIEKNKKILEDAESMNKDISDISQEMNKIIEDVKNIKEKAKSKQRDVEEYNKKVNKIQKANSHPEQISQKINLIKEKELKNTIKRPNPINISLIQLSSEAEKLSSLPLSKVISKLLPTFYIKGISPKGEKFKSWDINGKNVTGLFRSKTKSRVRDIIFKPYNQRKCIPKHISFIWENNGLVSTDEIDMPQSSSEELVFHINPKWFRDFSISVNQTYLNDEKTTCIPEFNLFDGVYI